MEGSDDGRTAIRLYDVNGRHLVYPAQGQQFAESLVHGERHRAARRGADDAIGRAPAEFFGHLIGGRLFTFDSVKVAGQGGVQAA